MRVFEDSRPEMRDSPKRFRVEILFSPGMTATPLHLNEIDRDSDLSRLDTAPLQMIGRDSLTCEELEEFFGDAIQAGRGEDEELIEMPSASGIPKSPARHKGGKGRASDNESTKKSAVPPLSRECSIFTVLPAPEGSTESLGAKSSDDDIKESPKVLESTNPNTESEYDVNTENGDHVKIFSTKEVKEDDREKYDDIEDDESVDTMTSEIVRKVVARKHFWTTVAIGSFVVGATCLLYAMHLAEDSRHRRPSRRFTA